DLALLQTRSGPSNQPICRRNRVYAPHRLYSEPVGGGRGSMLIHLAKFMLLSGVILFVAWLAGTGRVAYVMAMLWIAAALGYAVLDLVDYEIVKRQRRG